MTNEIIKTVSITSPKVLIEDYRKAKELNESILSFRAVIEKNYILLASNLREMIDGEYYKVLGHETLESYSASIGMSLRTVEYMAGIDRRFRALGIEPTGLTWTKAREILPILNENNKAEWLEKAKTMSVRDLIADVRTYKEAKGIKKLGAIGSIVIPFFSQDDWMTMLEGLELAAKVTGSDRRDIQFMAMCQEFMGTYSYMVEMEKDPVRRAILERDNYQCRISGCKKRTNIQIHEIVFRSHGGKVSENNSICCCAKHHADITEGRMKIERIGENAYKFIRVKHGKK